MCGERLELESLKGLKKDALEGQDRRITAEEKRETSHCAAGAETMGAGACSTEWALSRNMYMLLRGYLQSMKWRAMCRV